MATLTETVLATGKGKRTCYTQSDFEKMIHQGICYSIPMDVLHTIRDLDVRIKQKAVVQQKHFENKRFHVPKNNGQWKDRGGSSEPLGKGIGSTVSFKPTASLVNSGGATEHAKIIQRIKLNLNKLSQQNYDKLQKEIVEDLEILLTDFYQTEESQETRAHELIHDLFHIMSKTTDVKMSDLYAHCYFHWAQTLHATLFQQVMKEGIEEYCRQLTEFRLMDADRDGEAFCKYNRFVSEHRGRASFLIHYAKQSHGSMVGDLYNILQNNLVSEIMEYVKDTQATALKKMFVDEWIEHVVLFLNLGGSLWVDYSTNDYFVKIQTVLETLSQTDVKQWPNMTVRSKFKLQGVLKDLSAK